MTRLNATMKMEIMRIAKRYRLSPAVVFAVCEQESAFDTFAVRYERNWRWLLDPRKWAKIVQTSTSTERVLQSCSWGLMQVMGTVARERGFTNDFPRLCQVTEGLNIGCKHLSLLMAKHMTLPDALAAYNAGNSRSKAGKRYAEKVINRMDKFKVMDI